MTEDEFLAVVTEGQPSAPGYFLFNATLNKQQRDIRTLETAIPALSDEAIAAALGQGAIVLDARDASDFTAGHLKGAISVPGDGRMAETAGIVFTPDQQIIVMAPTGQEQEAALRLARIGFDQTIGYVPDPERYLLAHQDQVEQASRLTVAQADAALADVDAVQLIDIRNPGETAAGVIPGARLIPLPELPKRLTEIETDAPVVLYCAGGWRSSVGASLLRANGFHDVSDILGGYNAWAQRHEAVAR